LPYPRGRFAHREGDGEPSPYDGVLRRDSRRTRDLLLPKLISGEIDVSNLDIGTEGS
jgi:hypothetical protein